MQKKKKKMQSRRDVVQSSPQSLQHSYKIPSIVLLFLSSFFSMFFFLSLSLQEEEEEGELQHMRKDEGRNGRIEPVGRADSLEHAAMFGFE